MLTFADALLFMGLFFILLATIGFVSDRCERRALNRRLSNLRRRY